MMPVYHSRAPWDFSGRLDERRCRYCDRPLLPGDRLETCRECADAQLDDIRKERQEEPR